MSNRNAVRLAGWLGAVALAAGTFAAGHHARAQNRGRQDSPQRDPKVARLREGSQIHDRVGRFQLSGERVLFLPEDKSPESLRVLENLALERVAGAVADNGESSCWQVSGSITEFRGTNYLMITKAVLHLDRPKSP